MFKLNDVVKIKDLLRYGAIGEIVDVFKDEIGVIKYTVAFDGKNSKETTNCVCLYADGIELLNLKSIKFN
jgi:hypothetical protein